MKRRKKKVGRKALGAETLARNNKIRALYKRALASNGRTQSILTELGECLRKKAPARLKPEIFIDPSTPGYIHDGDVE
jgi:hypothetical protein